MKNNLQSHFAFLLLETTFSFVETTFFYKSWLPNFIEFRRLHILKLISFNIQAQDSTENCDFAMNRNKQTHPEKGEMFMVFR